MEMMHAAVVTSFAEPPHYQEFEVPQPTTPDEMLVDDDATTDSSFEASLAPDASTNDATDVGDANDASNAGDASEAGDTIPDVVVAIVVTMKKENGDWCFDHSQKSGAADSRPAPGANARKKAGK